MDYSFSNKYIGGNKTEIVVERMFADLQEEKTSG